MTSSKISDPSTANTGVDSAATVDGMSKSDNLPPPRPGQGVRQDIDPPLANVPLSNFIYTVSLGALILGLFFAFRMTEWKSQSGGILNILMGKRPDAPAPGAADMGAEGI